MHDQRLSTEDPNALDLDRPHRDQTTAKVPQANDVNTRRVIFGLTGLLGAAWAVVAASRLTSFSF